VSRAYGVLNDDATAADDPKRIASYLRSKRAWFIVDRSGVIRHAQVGDPRGLVPTDELLQIADKFK
jgi:alkyl hydroperoxide reductase subunit AhpC